MIRLSLVGLFAALTACNQEGDGVPQQHFDNRDDAIAAASRVSGDATTGLAACAAISYTDASGLHAAQMIGFDGDLDTKAIIPGSWIDVFADRKYVCTLDTVPYMYVTITTVADVGADCNDSSASVTVASTMVYADSDGDHYGSGGSSLACGVTAGFASVDGDCNDGDSAINPGAQEICDAGSVDEDCDGLTDDLDPTVSAATKSTWYQDADHDGYTGSTTQMACDQPTWTESTNESDCDDSSALRYPGNAEVCDGIDNNCDESVDEGVKTTFYADADSDGEGSPSAWTQSCSMPSGYVANWTDCNDGNAAINTRATEVCDSSNVDENCNGSADDADLTVSAATKSTWYADVDVDGYGSATTAMACDQPVGYVATSTDCNDASSAVHPGASETVCNGIDNDCDGSTDEDATYTNYYTDGDVDGYGAGSATSSCSAIAGSVTNNTDCNDGNSAIKPGGTETCNGTDDDCDGSTDEGVQTTYYRDSDGDTYGNPIVTTLACSLPSGYVTGSTDCDDADSADHPGGTETCNGDDEDCDGVADDGVKSTVYADADMDGYGDESASSTSACIDSTHVTNNTDCDDTLSTVNPMGTDIDNNDLDEDCDGEAMGQVCVGLSSTYRTKSWQLWMSDYTTFSYTPADPDWVAPGYAQGVGTLCGSFWLVEGHDLKFQPIIDANGNGTYGDSSDTYGYIYPSTINVSTMTIMGQSVTLGSSSILTWTYLTSHGADGKVTIGELPN